jgi:hypothetical protein
MIKQVGIDGRRSLSYAESRQNQLATNSIEILMMHLKKNRGTKTAAH